jgi:AraC-like DNA-binding protein
MLYEELDPLPGSSPWIANRWRFCVGPDDPESFEHVIVPDGALSISVTWFGPGRVSPVVFAGPSTTAHRVMVQRGFNYVGVRLHPAACGPVLGLDAETLADKLGLLEMVAPLAARHLDPLVQASANSEMAALEALDSCVQALASAAESPDPAVVRAVDALLETHGAVGVEALAETVGLSARQLRRKFLTHVGLTPKAFARVRRLRHTCIMLLLGEDAGLAGVSQDGGYADQPHFSREFRGSFGSSPRLVETYLRQIEHLAVKD